MAGIDEFESHKLRDEHGVHSFKFGVMNVGISVLSTCLIDLVDQVAIPGGVDLIMTERNVMVIQPNKGNVANIPVIHCLASALSIIPDPLSCIGHYDIIRAGDVAIRGKGEHTDITMGSRGGWKGAIRIQFRGGGNPNGGLGEPGRRTWHQDLIDTDVETQCIVEVDGTVI